jgi:hypothetical protein
MSCDRRPQWEGNAEFAPLRLDFILGQFVISAGALELTPALKR